MDYAAARRNMVESQLRPNKVTDQAVLDALASVPRELFVPEAMRDVAYVDEDVAVGPDRFVMEPMIIGRLLQLAAIKSSDVVLLVGCGTGYVAAVVARLASRVVAVESDAALRAWARQAIDGLGVTNVTIMAAPLNEGAPGQAPYDVIVFDGSVDVVPAGILDQLGEGGRLVAVLNKDRVGRAMLMTRTAGVIAGRPAFDAAVPRLPGLEVPAAFVF